MSTRRAASPLAALLALVVAACGGSVTPAPSVGPGTTPSPTAPSSASALPTAAPASPSASTGSSPAASASPVSTTAAPEPTPTGAFACAYPFQSAATRTDTALVRDVRTGAHDGYDRIVFELLGTGVPDLRVERVSPPFVKDPSGLPLTVPGSSFISILMTRTSGAGYASPDGQPTYTGPSSFQPNYSRLVSLVRVGDFEGYFSWIGGLTGPMCYQITELPSPARLVIDLRAP